MARVADGQVSRLDPAQPHRSGDELTPVVRWILGTVGAVVALVAIAAFIFWLWEPRLEQWGLIVLVGVIAYSWGDCVGTCRANLLEDERERKYGPWLWLTEPVVNEKGLVQQTDLGSGAVIETNPEGHLGFAKSLKVGGSARVTVQGVEIPFFGRQEALDWLRIQRRPVTEAQARHLADLQRQWLETARRRHLCPQRPLTGQSEAL